MKRKHFGQPQGLTATRMPLWHDSEMAAMAYALQNITVRRRAGPLAVAEKKCSECGAYAVIRKDGCNYRTQHGHLRVYR